MEQSITDLFWSVAGASKLIGGLVLALLILYMAVRLMTAAYFRSRKDYINERDDHGL